MKINIGSGKSWFGRLWRKMVQVAATVYTGGLVEFNTNPLTEPTSQLPIEEA